jgi:hypothetical protein
VPFRKKYDDATIEAAAERRRAGASLRDLEVETGIPRSTLSRRIAAYERERATAVPPPGAERRGDQPERSDTRHAPPREVTEAQARAQLAARVHGTDASPRSMLWKDPDRFRAWGTDHAYIFHAEDAPAIFTHPSPEFAGSSRRFGRGSAEAALACMAAAGLLYTNERDRIAVRPPKDVGWTGHDRVIAVPGCRTATQVGHIAFREWVRVYKPRRGGDLGEWLNRRDAEREARAAEPPDPRCRILDATGRERARCKQSNAERVAAALNLDGAWTIHPEPIAPAPAPS